MDAVKQLRTEVKKYIDDADIKVVKMVHAMLQVESESDWWANEKTLSLISERSESYQKNNGKAIPWKKAKKQILSSVVKAAK